MAVVVYKCDVCKREKEYLRNDEGLEKVQRCTITHGCRGKLFQVDLFSDYTRANIPEPVLGLDEWRQRKVLYNHTQSIARDSWIINHNLGTFPSISVFVNVPTEDNPDNFEELVPTDTIVVDENNTILNFERAWAGLAQLVARQSDPNLLKPFTRVIDTTEQDLQQLSKLGGITVATRDSTVGICDDITLYVDYTTTQNAVFRKSYTVSSVGDSELAWSDYDKVIIRGKIYTIRSYNAIFDKITDETIGFGSTFKYVSITICSSSPSINRAIEPNEVYLLLASAPYETADKLATKYVDVTDISATQNEFSLLYDANEFHIQQTVISSTYPPIRLVTQQI